MITLNDIVKELSTSYARVNAAYKRAGVKPIGNTGRTLLFNEADISSIREVLAGMPVRKRELREPPASGPDV